MRQVARYFSRSKVSENVVKVGLRRRRVRACCDRDASDRLEEVAMCGEKWEEEAEAV